MIKKPISNLDYIELYAKRLKDDNTLFAQQKMLIDSQIKSSQSFFRNAFSGKDFKKEARKYLKAVGLI